MQTVKVYYLNIEAVRGKENSLFSVLPESRVEKAKRFIKEDDRLLSLAAGYLVYRYIGGFFVDEFGKPRSENLFFSLSHSGERAALALSENREIGIDIERSGRDKDTDKLAEYCFNESELEAFSEGENFLSLFTAKESLAKAEGQGLKTDIKSISALPLNGKVEYKGKTYYRHTLNIDGYFASVSLEAEDFTVEIEEINII